MKKKTLSLLLALSMMAGMLPTAVLADDLADDASTSITEIADTDSDTDIDSDTDQDVTYTDAIDVVVSAQKHGTFLQLPTTLSVYADLSEEYGMTKDEPNHEPTVLDALVAAHIAFYGDDFTNETASDYLSGSSWVSTAFETDTYTGFTFAVNGEAPNDGVVSSWGSYTGYTADVAELADDDTVDFFFNATASNYTDYLTWFDAGEYEAFTSMGVDVTLEGYEYMSYGCSPNLDENIKNIEGATIHTVDENGELTALPFTTNANGVATIQFAEAGTYTISATGTVATTDYYGNAVNASIFCPLATVTVTDPDYAEILSTMEDAYETTLTLGWENVALKDVTFSEETIESAVDAAITALTADTINVSNAMKAVLTLKTLGYDPSNITLEDCTKLNAYDVLNENASPTSIYLAPYVLLALGDDATDEQKQAHIDFLCEQIVMDSNYTWGVDGAAIAIAAVAPYYDQEAVKTAVDIALVKLEATLVAGASSLNTNSDAMVILAYAMLGKDATTAVYSDGVNVVVDMLSAKLADGSGFGYQSNTTENLSATKQGMLALQALKAYAVEGIANPFDLHETAVNDLMLFDATITMPDSVWFGTADQTYYAFATSSEDFTHQFTTNIENPQWSSSSSYVTIDENGLATATPYSATSYRSAKITATSKTDENITTTTETVYFFYPYPTSVDAVDMAFPEDGLSTPSEYVSMGVSGLGDCVKWTLDEGQAIITTEENAFEENNYRFKATAAKPGTTTATATFEATNVNDDTLAAPSVAIAINVTGVDVKNTEGADESSVALVEGEDAPTVQLNAIVKDGNTYTWTSSNPGVATVDENGLVTTVSAGTAYIYATDSEGAKGGYRIQVTESGKPYFENLQFYASSSSWTTATFAAAQAEYDITINAYTTSSLYTTSTTTYDTDLYTATYSYTDSNGDLQEGTVNAGASTYYYNIPFGETALTITLAEIDNKDNATVITFNITRPRDTNKYLSTTGMVLVPDGRSLTTSTYNGYGEGVMFKADETGTTLGTTGVATTTYYYRTNLFEGDDTFSLKLTTSTAYAWVRYSIDDGNTWSDAVQYSGSTDSITIPAGATTQKVLIQVLDDTTYVANGNAFVADSATNYTIWVDQVSACAAVTQMESASFAQGTLYGASFNTFEPGVYTYSIVLPNANTDGATLTYTLPTGATATISGTTQTANEAGTYTLTWTSSSKTIVVTSADGTVSNSYVFTIIKQSGYDVPDAVVDYLVPASQYTNGTSYGYKPEYMLSGSLKSLGNFGGYVTFYYEDGITNDPNNLYGLDFYVQGNAASGTDSITEPGQVWVSEDNETWYALAGSEHYEDDTITDYTLTYTKTDAGKAAWVDSEGNSGSGTYNFPGDANYPLYDFGNDPDTITLTGILLPSALGVETTSSTANYATLPAFGYTDGSAKVGTTLSSYSVNDTNVYTESPSTGEGFDLAWAVDENGQPVNVDGKAFNYVKVVTASHVYAGAFGEKSTEVTYVIRTTPQESAVGVTDAPTGVTISSATGNTTVNFTDGQSVYDVDLGDAKYLTIGVNGADEADNIYVNNQRIAADGKATGFVVFEGNDKTVRIIVQNGDKEPVIYILNLTSSASSEGDGIEAIYANVAGSTREATLGNDGNYTLSVAYTVDSIGISAVTTEAYTIDEADVADSYDLATGKNIFTILTAAGQTVTLTVTKADVPSDSDKTINVYVTVYAPVDEYDAENPLVFSDSKSGFETILSKTKLEVSNGSTAWNAIEDALDDAGIDCENTSGNYITSVNGLYEFDRGSLSGWLYTVDGNYSEYGVNEYVLDNGDSIVLHYTDDYTQEEASKDFGGSSSSSTSATTSEDESNFVFSDVTSDAWCYDAVSYVVNAGLFNGTSDTTFDPDGTMTRAMIWMVLARNSGVDTETDGDVWYQVGQEWAMENSVSDGTNPDGNVTRQELAAMLYRYAVENGEDVSVGENTNILSYEDVMAVDEYAIPAMQWACGTGIVKGNTDSTLDPDGNATRAQVATMLMRYLAQ